MTHTYAVQLPIADIVPRIARIVHFSMMSGRQIFAGLARVLVGYEENLIRIVNLDGFYREERKDVGAGLHDIEFVRNNEMKCCDRVDGEHGILDGLRNANFDIDPDDCTDVNVVTHPLLKDDPHFSSVVIVCPDSHSENVSTQTRNRYIRLLEKLAEVKNDGE